MASIAPPGDFPDIATFEDDASLQRAVQRLSSDRFVLVIFTSEHCHVCRTLEKHLPWFGEYYRDEVSVILANPHRHAALAARHRIHGVPSLLVVRKGRILASEVGMDSRDHLKWLLKMAKKHYHAYEKEFQSAHHARWSTQAE
ncbi:MAG: thioredoxin family protein [Magnetococcales bacterium]|nr:thioredoxin family protein [Magnetococcales bacterium]